MSSVIPQPACQPWALASFDALDNVTSTEFAAANLPTIDQIAAIEEQAREEGRNAGHAEGYAAGLAEGREAAALEAARLRSLADTFTAELVRADEAISQQILDLALDLARALLKTALAVQPELVIPIVKEAVRYLPAMQQPALLYLNPDDAVLVQDRLGDALEKMGWQLTGDSHLEPGSCRVETASNQIDASLPTRWQRLVVALGRDTDWLAA